VDGFSVPVNCTSGIIERESFSFINWTADPKTEQVSVMTDLKIDQGFC
jgi:hypothetical protein